MRLNVICGNRSERIPRLINELANQGITDYELWDGIFLPSIKESINRAHKQIVEYAKLAGWEAVAIAEDDIKFTHENSWQYFLQNMPPNYDLYLSMVYTAEFTEKNIVSAFT